MARDLGIELIDGKDACTIVESDGDNVVLDVFLRDTTTLGVREHRCSRTALQRSVSEADSPWGPVRCKQAGGYGVSRKKYEFDDLARIARETGLSLPELLEKLP